MNKLLFHFVILLMSLVFFSCSPMRFFEIETYNPSGVTFPPEVKTVMIVNNSAQQPDDAGHRYMSNTKGESSLSISADSTAYTFCMSLGKAIAESPLFADVRICEDTLRIDSFFYNIKSFNTYDVRSICSDYSVDALITLDKIFFNTVFYDRDMSIINMNTASIEISGEMRAFWPGQKEVYKVPFEDTLSWFIEGNLDYENTIKEDLIKKYIRSGMLYIADYVGYDAHIGFVPHWSEDNRWYYTNVSSEWRVGTAYAVSEKWKEAAEAWEALYGKAKNWKHKARLSSNIALCNEMMGNFGKAVEYAEISYDLYKENDKADSSFVSLQKTYIETLNKRKRADAILSKQLNETD